MTQLIGLFLIIGDEIMRLQKRWNNS